MVKCLFLSTKMITENLDLGMRLVDTETMGLKSGRDRLCLVQMADAKGMVHLYKLKKTKSYKKI